MNRINLLGAFWLFITFPLLAQDLHSKRDIRVQLVISDKQEGFEYQIASYFTRELRKLGDVVLVDSFPHIRIGIVALQNTNRANYETGYTISICVTSRTCLIPIRISAYNWMPESKRVTFDQTLNTLDGILVEHMVRIVPPEGLQQECTEIVAEIDGRDFEAERKYLEQIESTFQDLMKKSKQ